MRFRPGPLFLLLVVAGCGGGSATGPPTVHYGQDVCAECAMIVSEERFAAAVVVEEDGRPEPKVFDDIGCLFTWEAEHADAAVLARWVHDYNGTNWAAAEAVWYVKSDDIRSPMGSGVASCAVREQADRLARLKKGEVLDWNALRTLAASEGLVTPPPAAVET